MDYGFFNTRWGGMAIACNAKGVTAALLCTSPEQATTVMQQRFTNVELHRVQSDDKRFVSIVEAIDSCLTTEVDLTVSGTEFQQTVWRQLCDIPRSQTTTYADIARKIGRPKAVRAVGHAIGANPIAIIVPCHRVLRSDGGMGGYYWGVEMKERLLDYEQLTRDNK